MRGRAFATGQRLIGADPRLRAAAIGLPVPIEFLVRHGHGCELRLTIKTRVYVYIFAKSIRSSDDWKCRCCEDVEMEVGGRDGDGPCNINAGARSNACQGCARGAPSWPASGNRLGSQLQNAVAASLIWDGVLGMVRQGSKGGQHGMAMCDARSTPTRFFDSESWTVEGGIPSIGTGQSNVTLGKGECG